MPLKPTRPRDAVADAIARLVDDRGRAWSGTAAELFEVLGAMATSDELADVAWPRSGVALQASLVGLSDALRDRGLRITRMPDAVMVERLPPMMPGARPLGGNSRLAA